MKRVVLVILDSLGVGALPDAESYGDLGADTLGHIALSAPDFAIPHLVRLGIGNIDGVAHVEKTASPTGAFGRLAEASKGKDTITGHWEIAGLYTETPFQTFPDGFPATLMQSFEEAIGRGTLGNYAASGTEIIQALGQEHEETGKPIIYTSADSVFQIAANTAVIPLAELYRICEIARNLLVGDLQVGRVIARPYVLEGDQRVRTSDRKDYAVSPTGKTVLDQIKDNGQTVYAIGKIEDIYNGQGISVAVHTKSNDHGVTETLKALAEPFGGLIFTNLVDFDSKYGHRRDPKGYAQCLEEFDRRLPEILAALKDEDVLILCADHGNDPVHTGWDHTREYIPVLVYGKGIKAGVNLGTRSTFADIGATIAEMLAIPAAEIGQSFLAELVSI